MKKQTLLLSFALLVAGCAHEQPKVLEASYVPSAAFVQLAPQNRSDFAIIRNDYQTNLWKGSPYNMTKYGPWDVTETRIELVEIEDPETHETTDVPMAVEYKTMERVVHFDFDKHKLRSDAIKLLDSLPVDEADHIVIDAHTDAKGSDSYNDKLSDRRAESVRKYLMSRGVPADKFQVAGHGKKDPVDTNKTKEGRAKNRRATIFLNIGVKPQDCSSSSCGDEK